MKAHLTFSPSPVPVDTSDKDELIDFLLKENKRLKEELKKMDQLYSKQSNNHNNLYLDIRTLKDQIDDYKGQVKVYFKNILKLRQKNSVLNGNINQIYFEESCLNLIL